MSYKIYPLKIGQCQAKEYLLFYNSQSETTHALFLYVWLIKGADKPIIVDTGPKDLQAFNRMVADYIPGGVIQAPQEDLLEQLKKAQVKPEEVSHIFITHLHYDHCTNIHLFPEAKVVVSKKGFIANLPGGIPKDFIAGLIPGWPDRLKLAEEEEEILPGIKVFWIGGHSPCSQAIAVETEKGKAILCGDTVYLYKNIEENIPIGLANLQECQRAMHRIHQEGEIILPSHDPEVLKRFPKGEIP